MATLWLQGLANLPKPSGNKRPPPLRRKPLFCLTSLQSAIRSGTLGTDAVFLATTDCRSDLGRRLRWTLQDLLDYLTCLRAFDQKAAHDFLKAEWCKDSGGRWHACDSYAMHYDKARKCRDAKALNIYLKFSIEEDDSVLLVVISAHD